MKSGAADGIHATAKEWADAMNQTCERIPVIFLATSAQWFSAVSVITL